MPPRKGRKRNSQAREAPANPSESNEAAPSGEAHNAAEILTLSKPVEPSEPREPHGASAELSEPHGAPAEPREPHGAPAEPREPHGAPAEPSEPHGAPAEPAVVQESEPVVNWTSVEEGKATFESVDASGGAPGAERVSFTEPEKQQFLGAEGGEVFVGNFRVFVPKSDGGVLLPVGLVYLGLKELPLLSQTVRGTVLSFALLHSKLVVVLHQPDRITCQEVTPDMVSGDIEISQVDIAALDVPLAMVFSMLERVTPSQMNSDWHVEVKLERRESPSPSRNIPSPAKATLSRVTRPRKSAKSATRMETKQDEKDETTGPKKMGKANLKKASSTDTGKTLDSGELSGT